MSGTLFIIATPIGNLEDVSSRALKTLKEVDLILAEDTRVTKKLLDHYQIKTPVLAYHQRSSPNTKYSILNTLLQSKKVALVTDAGTPGISDPGNELIDFLYQHSAVSSSLLRGPSAASREAADSPRVAVIPIPGPSALTAALSVCGFDVSRLAFFGFLPKKKRTKVFTQMRDFGASTAFFESPYRIGKTVDDLANFFGADKRVFIGQELTKMHERTFRGTLAEVKTRLEKEKSYLGRIKGEVVVILEGKRVH